MFAGWFSPSFPTQDRVWLDAAACTRGLQRDVTRALRDDGVAVLLLLRGTTEVADMARALAGLSPRVCDDRYAAADLQPHLVAAGALGISRVEALRPIPPTEARPTPTPLQVHVRGRGDRRSDDHRLLEGLKAWMPASIVFHHSLDDRLLRENVATMKPLLGRLGLGADAAVSSALIGRAIQRLQRP